MTHELRAGRFLRTALALAAAGSAFHPPAWAQASPWYVGLSHQTTYENNLWRLNLERPVPADIASTNDWVSRTSLLGGLDQRIGRQRVFGSVAVRAERHKENSELNNNGHALALGWDWETVQSLSGRLDAGSDRRLARLNDDAELGAQTRSNVEDVRRAGATVRLGGAGLVSLEGSLGWRETRYSAVEYEGRENSQTSAAAGLRWRPTGGVMVGLGLRGVDGKVPRFQPLGNGEYLADEWRREGAELLLALEPTGASRIDARLEYGRTRYEEATQRDYSGLTGMAAWTWQIGGRLRLQGRLSRDDGQNSTYVETPFMEGASNFSRVTDAFMLRADYELTSKTKISLAYTRAERELVRTLPDIAGQGNPFDAQGRDRTHDVTLGARWQATRWLGLGCGYTSEQRSAEGSLSISYRSKRAGCQAEVMLR